MSHYRSDKDWQKQQLILLDDTGEADEKLVRTIAAAKAMQRIEAAHSDLLDRHTPEERAFLLDTHMETPALSDAQVATLTRMQVNALAGIADGSDRRSSLVA